MEKNFFVRKSGPNTYDLYDGLYKVGTFNTVSEQVITVDEELTAASQHAVNITYAFEDAIADKIDSIERVYFAYKENLYNHELQNLWNEACGA